jgi:hypothetical protein
MKPHPLTSLALILWIVTLAAATWFFVKGQTRTEADGRTAILLAQTERVAILGEMRQLLKSVHGVIEGIGQADQAQGRKQAEQAARAAGMGMAADVNPTLMAKLPLAFKQMGMSVHKDFDVLAVAIAEGAPSSQVLNRLAGITSRCTTCHDVYRLAEEK